MKKILILLFSLSICLYYSTMALAMGDWTLNQMEIGGGDSEDKYIGEVNYTKFKGAELKDFTAYCIHRKENGLLALGYRRTGLAAFKSGHAIIQYQSYQDDFLTVVTTVGYEDKNIDDNFAYGSLYLRLYPLHNLMFQSGTSVYDSFQGDFDSGTVNLDLHIEWQPENKKFSNFSIFYEENLFDKQTIGIRYRLDERTLFVKHRSGGILGF
ncbi:MAG: hypothetical protein GXP19_01855 [Gammaproteobacteria bacterium]|nr:hypothetical protein [Gammaproteobacteria bacterium]